MERLHGHTIQRWFAEFVDTLQECGSEAAPPAPTPLIAGPGAWPQRAIHRATARLQ